MPQVATGDQVHMARIDVMIQEMLVEIHPVHRDRSNSSSLRLSVSVLTSNDEESKLTAEQYSPQNRDVPCMTMVNTAFTWLGSFCFSACKSADAKESIDCPVPFPSDGAVCQAKASRCAGHIQ